MCNEKLGTEENPTPYATAIAYAEPPVACQWWSRCDAITSDLHALPLVFAAGQNMEDLFEQLGFWVFGQELTPESMLAIEKAVALAECPSDGMVGTTLTKPIILPQFEGMVFHLQFS